MAGRALPMQMCQYRHAIIMYKLFNEMCCDDEFVQLNLQLQENQRSNKLVFVKWLQNDVGKIKKALLANK